MDIDPRSPTSELRRLRVPVTKVQSSKGQSSLPQPGSRRQQAGSTDLQTTHPAQHRSQPNLQNVLGSPENLQVSPSEHPVETPSEQSIETIMNSNSLVQSEWGLSSPDTVGRSSTHRSDSTMPYSTDWTPLDGENEKEMGGFLSPRSPMVPQIHHSPRGSQATTGIYPWPNISQKAFQDVPQSQPYRASVISSGSFDTASMTSSSVDEEPGHRTQQPLLEELFPFAKARLENITYKPPRSLKKHQSSPDKFRRRMLKNVFGWTQDTEDLVRDELTRHPPNSTNVVILSKWLGDPNVNAQPTMMNSSKTWTSTWMLLALSQVNGQTMSKDVAWALARKMLKKGDIHLATSILIGVGEYHHAIDIYTMREYFLEAILLTCLKFPKDSAHQSALVRSWGNQVLRPSRQFLAMRCLSCSVTEPSESWTSLNVELADLLTRYTRQAGVISSTPPNFAYGDTELPPNEQSPYSPHSHASSTVTKKNQSLGLKIITSDNTIDGRQHQVTSQSSNVTEHHAKAAEDLKVPTETPPPPEIPSSHSTSSKQNADQPSGRSSSDGQSRLPPIRETPREAEFSQVNLPEAVRNTAGQVSTDISSVSGTVNSIAPPRGSHPRPATTSRKGETRNDTPHPDFSRPNGQHAFNATATGTEPRKEQRNLNAHARAGASSSGMKQHKPREENHAALESHRGHRSNSVPRHSGSVRGASQTDHSPSNQSFQSVCAPREPLSEVETSWKIDQYIDGLHSPTSYPQERRAEEQRPRHGEEKARERSVGRGRSRQRAPLTSFSSSSSESLPLDDRSDWARRRLKMKKLDESHSGRQARHSAKKDRSKTRIRGSSEPAQLRRARLSSGSSEKSEPQQASHRPAPNSKVTSWRYAMPTHEMENFQPRENCVIWDEKDHQRRIGYRRRPNSISNSREEANPYPGANSHDRDANKVPKQQDHVTASSRRSSESFPTPVAQPAGPQAQDEQFSSMRETSTDSDIRSSNQGSRAPMTDTQTTYTASISTECVESRAENVAHAEVEHIPRPSSCPSPRDEPSRRVDLHTHPAFHHNIRPSSTRPDTSNLASREPPHGQQANLREAWDMLDSLKNVNTSTPDIVEDATTITSQKAVLSDEGPTRNPRPRRHASSRSVNEGITNKFKAMADRVRSPSRGRNKGKAREDSISSAATATDSTNMFKVMADRVRSPSRGRKDENELPYEPTQNPPYESVPPFQLMDSSPLF